MHMHTHTHNSRETRPLRRLSTKLSRIRLGMNRMNRTTIFAFLGSYSQKNQISIFLVELP